MRAANSIKSGRLATEHASGWLIILIDFKLGWEDLSPDGETIPWLCVSGVRGWYFEVYAGQSELRFGVYSPIAPHFLALSVAWPAAASGSCSLVFPAVKDCALNYETEWIFYPLSFFCQSILLEY